MLKILICTLVLSFRGYGQDGILSLPNQILEIILEDDTQFGVDALKARRNFAFSCKRMLAIFNLLKEKKIKATKCLVGEIISDSYYQQLVQFIPHKNSKALYYPHWCLCTKNIVNMKEYIFCEDINNIQSFDRLVLPLLFSYFLHSNNSESFKLLDSMIFYTNKKIINSPLPILLMDESNSILHHDPKLFFNGLKDFILTRSANKETKDFIFQYIPKKVDTPNG